jgi:hypothetical protein
MNAPVDVLAVFDRAAKCAAVDANPNYAGWHHYLIEARAAVAELIAAANEMMRQDAVQRATEITNPFMAGAADKLASALRKVGAR